MPTSPTPQRNSTDVSSEVVDDHSAVVVRLLPRPAPESTDNGTDNGTENGTDTRTESRRGAGVPVDADRLARAVSDLIRAIDPGLRARIRVEIEPAPAVHHQIVNPAPTPPPAPEPEPGPAPALGVEPGTELRLDVVGRTLTVVGQAVALTRREFDLLAYLRDRRGAALGRRELMNAVWHTGYLAGDRTIDVHVRRLRMKLGTQAHRLTTLRGYGYRLD